MIFVDTGYLIALLNPRDQLHLRAINWSRAVHDPLTLTEYVLWECVNYFSMPADRPKAQALVGQLRSDPAFEIIDASRALFDSGVHLHGKRLDKEWSLTDCVSFVVMQERGITRALAHDRHFEEAGFEALLRRDP